jgi:hypothetical protein
MLELLRMWRMREGGIVDLCGWWAEHAMNAGFLDLAVE